MRKGMCGGKVYAYITIQLLDLNPVQVPCPHPTPDPFLDEEQTGWCDLHSLSSLKLTLDRVIQDCILPQSVPMLHHTVAMFSIFSHSSHCPLEEFPLATETEPPTTELHAPLR